jgi:hypothetical protein
MMKVRMLVAVSAAISLAAAGAAVAVIANASPSGTAPHAGDHVVRAAEHGTGRTGSLAIHDPLAAGSKLVKIEYHLHDGYTKRVIIPGGAFVAAEDIAICGVKGQRYPNIGFVGTGLPCKPALHNVEIRYHQHAGDLTGRFRPPRREVVTEHSHGHGRYLTVGHIDHGALMSVEYYWANGEHLTVNLRGEVLVNRATLNTGPGKLAAVLTRHR